MAGVLLIGCSLDGERIRATSKTKVVIDDRRYIKMFPAHVLGRSMTVSSSHREPGGPQTWTGVGDMSFSRQIGLNKPNF